MLDIGTYVTLTPSPGVMLITVFTVTRGRNVVLVHNSLPTRGLREDDHLGSIKQSRLGRWKVQPRLFPKTSQKCFSSWK